MRKLKSCSFYFFAVIFFASGFFVNIAHAEETIVLESILEENTHWMIDGSPYLIYESLLVNEGVTLTIDPGVIVKMENSASFVVYGSVMALGTFEDPIYFTSGADDTLGGDTNYDEDDTTPQKGDWYGIIITPESDDPNIDNSTQESSTLNYVISRYSGGGLLVSDKNVTSEGLNMGEEVSLFNSNSTFNKLSATTLNLYEGSTATINNSIINCTEEYSNGVSLSDASKLDISNSTVSINNPDASNGILASNGSALSLDNIQINIIGNDWMRGLMIFDEGTTLDMKGSSIKSSGSGLFIYADPGENVKATVDNSIFECAGARCVEGYNSSILMTNSKVSGATVFGVFYVGGPVTKEECTESTNEDGELEETCVDVLLPSVEFELNNNEIFNNKVGINSYGGKVIGKKNNIHNNTIDLKVPPVGAFNLTPEQGGDIMDLRNNYWGDKTGPKNLTTNPDGIGDEVSDSVLYSPFLKIDPLIPTKTPVIIVPGVMGTEMFNGDEKLWLDLMHNLTDIGDQFMDTLQFKSDLTPLFEGMTVGDIIRKETADIGIGEISLFDYSYGLIQELKNQGYIEGTDLFVFPYDWRYGVNDANIEKLKQKVSDILTQTGKDKIDIIAHSTGGLLVKKYAMDYPTENHIDKAIFVGVPNTGAPQAIKAFLVGNNFGNPFLANNEVKKIAVNMPVIYDLSPSQQYFNTKGSFVEIIDDFLLHFDKKDLDFDQTDSFLINDHKLNSQALKNTHNLHTLDFDNYDLRMSGIDPYNIVGCKAGTTGKVIERRTHGLLMDSVEYDKPKEVPGDGTVPLESATNLPVDQDHKFFALEASHGKMLSQNGIRQQIVNIISESNLSTENLITQDISQCKLNGRAIAVYSPIAIDVVDQNNNHSGLSSDGVSIENNIPNASFEIMGDHKFVYLPDDDGQIYDISIKGTGDGVFTITDSKIVDNQTISMQVFSEIPVTPALTGNINLGDVTNLEINSNNQEISPTYTLDADHIQDFDPTHKDIINNQNHNSYSSSGALIKPIAVPSILVEEKQNFENSQITPIIKNNSPTKVSSISKKNPNPNQNLNQKENFPQNNNLLASSASSKINIKLIVLLGAFVGIFAILLVKKLLKR